MEAIIKGLVLLYIIYGRLLLPCSAADERETNLMEITCDDTTTSIETEKLWRLTNPKVSPLPASCQWNFTIATMDVLQVNIRGRLRNPNSGHKPCLIMTDLTPNNVFRLRHEPGTTEGAYTWCFRKKLHIEYKASRCPEPPEGDGLSVVVRRVIQGMPYCEGGKAWMWSCKDNLANRTLLTDSSMCIFTRLPDTTNLSEGKTKTPGVVNPPVRQTDPRVSSEEKIAEDLYTIQSDHVHSVTKPSETPIEVSEVGTQPCVWGQSQKMVILGACVMAAIFFITLGMLIFWYCLRRTGHKADNISLQESTRLMHNPNLNHPDMNTGPSRDLHLHIPQSSSFTSRGRTLPTPPVEEYHRGPDSCPILPNSGTDFMRPNGAPGMYRRAPVDRGSGSSGGRSLPDQVNYPRREAEHPGAWYPNQVALPRRKRTQSGGSNQDPDARGMPENGRVMQPSLNRLAPLPPGDIEENIIDEDLENIEMSMFSM